MLRFLVASLLLVACSGGCGGASTEPEHAEHGAPERLEPGLGDETATSTGSGPRRIEEEAVDPPPVEPPPP